LYVNLLKSESPNGDLLNHKSPYVYSSSDESPTGHSPSDDLVNGGRPVVVLRPVVDAAGTVWGNIVWSIDHTFTCARQGPSAAAQRSRLILAPLNDGLKPALGWKNS